MKEKGFQLAGAQFRLPDKDQGHRALRVDLRVQEEPELLKGLLVQQMGFIQDAHDLFVLQAALTGSDPHIREHFCSSI